MGLETPVAHTVNDECFTIFCKSEMHKHSTWGVLSQGRNSKELTARETNGGTLGFNRKQRRKPYQCLYVDTTIKCKEFLYIHGFKKQKFKERNS